MTTTQATVKTYLDALMGLAVVQYTARATFAWLPTEYIPRGCPCFTGDGEFKADAVASLRRQIEAFYKANPGPERRRLLFE